MDSLLFVPRRVTFLALVSWGQLGVGSWVVELHCTFGDRWGSVLSLFVLGSGGVQDQAVLNAGFL